MKATFAASWNQISWQAKGICLLILNQARTPSEVPETQEGLRFMIGKTAARYWPEIFPWITDLKILVDKEMSNRQARKRAADKRWGAKPVVAKAKPAPAQKPSSRTIRLSILQGDSPQCFNRLWESWPKRTDGKPARGEKAKAEALFQEIVDAGVANAWELEEAAHVYCTHYPNVKEGYVKMVCTFFSIKDGMWRECLERVRRGPKAAELAAKSADKSVNKGERYGI